MDARKGVSLEAARRVTDENLASRAYMNTGTSGSSSPYAHLMLELLTPDDAGEYACRVDFRKERTRNSVIFLKIIGKWNFSFLTIHFYVVYLTSCKSGKKNWSMLQLESYFIIISHEIVIKSPHLK